MLLSTALYAAIPLEHSHADYPINYFLLSKRICYEIKYLTLYDSDQMSL